MQTYNPSTTDSSMSKNGSDAMHMAGDKLMKASGKVLHLVDSASTKMCDATKTTKSHIEHNPVRSTLIALGAGYVLGKLFGR